jgi:L-tyrosine isonitrile synthase
MTAVFTDPVSPIDLSVGSPDLDRSSWLPSPSVIDDSLAILQLLLPYRRAADDAAEDRPEAFPEQLAQLAPMVALEEPVVFTLPGFPCKSPNPAKVIDRFPDCGERLSLRFLEDLCRRIERIYAPGARMVICSDGHVFADLIGVPDPHVDAYGDALRNMIRDEGMTRIETWDLRHVFGSRTASEKRSLLDERYAADLEALRAQVTTDAETRRLYCGITKFMVEDTVAFEGSRSALQRQSREKAYRVIQRSRAWGNLVADRYPKSLRLSIHPQPRGSRKLGIRLLDIDDAWMTPWHSVVLRHPDGRCELVPHHRAQQLGRLVTVDGRPDHYVTA